MGCAKTVFASIDTEMTERYIHTSPSSRACQYRKLVTISITSDDVISASPIDAPGTDNCVSKELVLYDP